MLYLDIQLLLNGKCCIGLAELLSMVVRHSYVLLGFIMNIRMLHSLCFSYCSLFNILLCQMHNINNHPFIQLNTLNSV